jgi:hypothetical protein
MSVIGAPNNQRFDGDAKFHRHDRQDRKKITQTLDGQGFWGLCIKKAAKNFETLLASSS